MCIVNKWGYVEVQKNPSGEGDICLAGYYASRGWWRKVSHPCGGGVEYLHRDLASRRRRRKGKSQIWDSKIWSRVPRDSDPRKTTLARASSMYKRQTRPLVREGAPQNRTVTANSNEYLVMSPTPRLTDSLTHWPSVTWLWLTLAVFYTVGKELESLFITCFSCDEELLAIRQTAIGDGHPLSALHGGSLILITHSHLMSILKMQTSHSPVLRLFVVRHGCVFFLLNLSILQSDLKYCGLFHSSEVRIF
jgi:hypothetical protein